MSVANAQVFIDPYVKHLIYVGKVVAVPYGVVRINGQDVDMYDILVWSTEGPAPPANGVLSIIAKFFVNAAPATVDYLYFLFRDANRVPVAEFQIHAVSDPIKIDAVGEYIVNISIVISAPQSVNVVVR